MEFITARVHRAFAQRISQLALSAVLVVVAAAAQAAPLNPQHRNFGIAPSQARPSLRDFAAEALYTPSEYATASELQMTEDTFDRIASSIAGTVDKSTSIVVLVNYSSRVSAVTSAYQSYGGDTSKLKVVVVPTDSFWYQDFGPIYSVDASGELVSNDFIYSRFNRHNDDTTPARLAKLQGVKNRQVSMDYEGGNFISDGHGTCFASSRVYQQNPNLSQSEVQGLMKANLGCQKTVILTPLEDDDTFHIDLFAKLVSDRTFLVGDFVDHPRNQQIMNQNAQILQNMGYNIVRIPVRMPELGTYYTHINSFLINGYALLPTYGIAEDQTAAEAYRKLGYKVLPVDAADLAPSGGALHCILRSKPAIH